MDVGETEVTALHAVGQPLVVHPEQVEHRRVEVVDVHRAADRGEADLIGLPVRVPGLDPAACHPEREGLDMVVAAELLPHLAQRSATELASPDHQGVLEHPEGLEVPDERSRRPVDLPGPGLERAAEVVVGVAVVVPVRVVELDETRSTLEKPPCEQAVPRERGGGRIHPVEIQSGLRLRGEIDRVRSAGLHAMGELVGAHPLGDGRCAHLLAGQPVERLDELDGVGLSRVRDPLRRPQVEDGIAAGPERRTAARGRKEPVTPERRAAPRTTRAGLEHDEARKIVGLRTQPVKTPRAAARPAEETVPGVHEQLRGPMVDLLPLHAPQEAELVRDSADVRE